MYNRLSFSRNLALGVMVAQMGLVVMLLSLMLLAETDAERDGIVGLIRISVPIAGTYFVAIVTWFARGSDVAASDRKISMQAIIGLSLVVLVIFGMMFAGAIIFAMNANIPEGPIHNFFAAIELSFGAALGVIAREFFGHQESDTAAAETPVQG